MAAIRADGLSFELARTWPGVRPRAEPELEAEHD
jgi:hypothetical protein